MNFQSSRDVHHIATASEAIQRGLAPDGGLYVPQTLPHLSLDKAGSLAAIAQQMLTPFFAQDPLASSLSEIAREALNIPASLVPLVGAPSEVDVLELFHGPTLAFKDFGARFLAATLARLRAGSPRPLRILLATSGDTGGAVAAAFHRKSWVNVVSLFPQGRVSPRQEKQLTCWDANVKSIAVRGTFDDCQQLVKAAFLDPEIRSECDLSSANSINLGRLLPQMTYYATASLAVRERSGQAASFIIPTGNLGNAMACIWARQMGLPIEEIVLGHNVNRAVPDFLATGHWRPRPSIQTLATAMDVGNPSNIERLTWTYPEMESLRRSVSADAINDDEIRSRIREDFRTYGRVWCPHSAVAAEVYARMPDARKRARRWVIVATAHPAKFSEIVEPLIERAIEVPPALLASLSSRGCAIEMQARLQDLRQIIVGSKDS